jgi:hypothetical protein
MARERQVGQMMRDAVAGSEQEGRLCATGYVLA